VISAHPVAPAGFRYGSKDQSKEVKAQIQEFLNTLTPEEKKSLDAAHKWWYDTYIKREK